MDTGFQSLIELLVRNDTQIKSKNKALADAVERRKLHLVELLVEHGAEVSSVPFADVLRTWDPRIIRFFLDRGADVILKGRRACTAETVHEFLDTPPMQKHLAGNEWHLRRLGAAVPPSRSPSYVPYGLLARFNRDQLYEEVWSQPMWKLAPKYKVSDVALAKTCRKLKIPVPGRGYWAKLAAGKALRARPPLPPFPTPHRTSKGVES